MAEFVQQGYEAIRIGKEGCVRGADEYLQAGVRHRFLQGLRRCERVEQVLITVDEQARCHNLRQQQTQVEVTKPVKAAAQ